jgi:glycosyltransferase involved in cell wall biosynthesis
MSNPESKSDSSPLMVGLGLGRGNGGPYKTIMQFRAVQGGHVISFSDQSTEVVAGDGIRHIMSRSGVLGRRFLLISAADRREFGGLVEAASHVQCHILYRYHAHLIWNECRRLRKPYWVVPHGCLDPYVFSYRRLQKMVWMQLFGRRFLRDARYVIFASKRELRKSQRWLGRDNARVVHWPVEMPVHSRNSGDRQQLRVRLGLPGDARVLLWLGRLHEMKRPLESARLFADSNLRNCHLVFVGNDEMGLGPNLREIVAAAPLRNVHWIGPLYGAKRDEVMRGCDGYWSYSVRENFNHAAAEALAAGLPVILSPGNDLCEDLEGAGAGWLLNSDSANAAGQALREWAETSDETLGDMGRTGRSWANQILSVQRFEQNLRNLEVGLT